MGITLLEENYQRIRDGHPALTAYFTGCAERASFIQIEMRSIFNHITPHLCTPCENKCCEGFPLEGWFSLEDYTLFRTKHEKPVSPPNRINHPTACSFVTPRGCSLPEDLRPFTCVKINCSKVTEALKDRGEEEHFKQLITVLDEIHRDISSTIKQHKVPLATYRTLGEKNTNLFNNV
jgi:hypothetical protein